MHVDHLRYGSDSDGTIGRLRIRREDGGPLFDSFCIERPWQNNERSVSCIPDGKYDLVTHTWRKNRPGELLTFALVNENMGIYHYPNAHATRDLILLHPANRSSQLQGCIAPVRSITKDGGELFGPSSGPTLNQLLTTLEGLDGPHTYSIRWADHG